MAWHSQQPAATTVYQRLCFPNIRLSSGGIAIQPHAMMAPRPAEARVNVKNLKKPDIGIGTATEA